MCRFRYSSLDYYRIITKLSLEWVHINQLRNLGPVSQKSRELFGPEKPFVKLWPAYSVKLVFKYVVKGIKIKITAKFRASRRLRFEDSKRIMSPEIRPKSFGTFEKQAPDCNWIIIISNNLSQGSRVSNYCAVIEQNVGLVVVWGVQNSNRAKRWIYHILFSKAIHDNRESHS